MEHRPLLPELQIAFQSVYRRMAREWGKYVEEGISTSQAIILENLSKRGRLRASDLAEVLNITSGAVTGLCDKLIACGYAKRSRTEEDRRVVYLEITHKGLSMLESVRQRRKEIIKMFFGPLSDEDIRHLIRIYNQVLQNIELRE